MTSKILIFFCAIAVANAAPKRVARVAHGEDAKPGQYPYQVNLYYKKYLDPIYDFPISLCGGAILNREWIVTAAMCVKSVKNLDDIAIKAGNVYLTQNTGSEQTVDIKEAFVNPKYNNSLSQASSNDLALIKLATPLNFNEFVAPIGLPAANSIPEGEGTIAGIGSTRHMINTSMARTLQSVTLPIISNDECIKNLHDAWEYTGDLKLIDESNFCTGPTASLQGYCVNDHGNVLVSKKNDSRVIVGVATFGFAADCETPGLPSIFTRVSGFVDWIKKTIDEN